MHRNSGRNVCTFYFYFFKQIILLKYRKYQLWPSLLGPDDPFLKCSLDLTNGMLGCTREHNAESPLSKTKMTEVKRVEMFNSSLVFEPFWTPGQTSGGWDGGKALELRAVSRVQECGVMFK